MNTRLNIETCGHSLMFRRIDSLIRRNTTVARVFSTILSWTGGDDDALPWAPDLCPGLRLTPTFGEEGWYSFSGFKSDLLIDYEVAILGTQVEDLMDLAQVLRRAIYPKDAAAALVIQQALIADRASETGQPLFNAPGYRPMFDGQHTMLIATGQIKIDVLIDVQG